MRLIYVLPLLLALQSAQAADCNLQRGKVLFESKCAMCHSAQQGEAHSVGPNLFGVVGRLKGRAQAFDYSEAMQKTGGRINAGASNSKAPGRDNSPRAPDIEPRASGLPLRCHGLEPSAM